MKISALRLSLAIAVIACPLAAHADPVFGTISFNFRGVTPNPSMTAGGPTPLDPFTGITSLNFTSTVFGGDLTGSFLSAPVGPADNLGAPITGSGSTMLYPNTGNGGPNGATPFTLIFDNLGTFTEVGAPVLNTQTVNPQTLTMVLNGTFTPGVAFPAGSTAGISSINTTFTESIVNNTASYSGSGTLQVNAPVVAPTPEPSSLVLLGTGLLGVAGMARRKFLGR